jgi:ribosomal peptide maturation radical SAM protein 1
MVIQGQYCQEERQSMIHLVNMPICSLSQPSLALGVIQAQLRQAGYDSRTHNFNLDFAQQLGIRRYMSIGFFTGVNPRVAEWLFAEQAWGEVFGPSAHELTARCNESNDHNQQNPPWVETARHDLIPVYLQRCIAQLAEDGAPRIVAFSCTFFQTIASLALGRLIKQRFPRVKLVYGGACFHSEMGAEIMQQAPWIDAVSTGEADDVVLPLFAALDDDRPLAGLQGIVYRDEFGLVQPGPPSRPVSREVLDDLPDPDFDDFFTDAKRLGLYGMPEWQRRVILPFESSRGCWWGEKQHCTFCGLNGSGMAYRARSADKVDRTLRHFASHYPGRFYQAADNILSMGYFHDLLPRLAEQPLGDGIALFYEVKSNLNRTQIAAMARAGIVYVQPGIESLSTHVLQLMRKGVTGLHNVFFLKCCLEHGIMCFWNLLTRVPGEEPADYRQQEAWLPKLFHLYPPTGVATIKCHRDSPYFFAPGRWIENIRPQSWYAGLFPERRVNLFRVAYYFDADWKQTLEESSYAALTTLVQEWTRVWRQEESARPRLVMQRHANGRLRIEDTRRGKPTAYWLDTFEAEVYRSIDDPAGIRTICARLPRTLGRKVAEEEVRACLERLTEAGLALREKERYLGLALPGAVL